MEFERELKLEELLQKKSHFLLGPRSTGKTSLVRNTLKNVVILDLLKSDFENRLLAHPEDLEVLIEGQLREGKRSIVVIDEIQKIPQLLNEVHRLIEEKKWKFLLTGSSARKLKSKKINLLAGRAWMAHLFPLTWKEMKKQFQLEKYLLYGGLPQVCLSDYPAEELKAYVQTYLNQEIRMEALVRKIPQFSRFLEVAALSNTQLLNFTEIGNDSDVPPSTIREYYAILEDTLMGFLLPPWTKSRKRKAIQTAKFYFFDSGVVHTLTQTTALDRHSDLYGRAFEHFLAMELKAFLSYRKKKDSLSFWRSINGQEVDFLIGNEVAIEVKSTRRLSRRDFKNLEALKEEKMVKDYYLVTQDPVPLKKENIVCLPWFQFLEELWSGKVF